MAAPSVSPEIPTKDFRWKRLFIKATGFGAGFALILVILAGIGIWYWNRPKPPKPWNTQAITASFDRMDVSIKNGILEIGFFYSLQNNTDYDYTINGEGALFLRTLNSGNLEPTGHFAKRVEVFVPAKHRAGYDVVRLYTVGKDAPDSVKTTDGINTFFYKEFHNVDGFVLFDQSNRYEITLPNGWKDMKEK
jgi:hypothetical protein